MLKTTQNSETNDHRKSFSSETAAANQYNSDDFYDSIDANVDDEDENDDDDDDIDDIATVHSWQITPMLTPRYSLELQATSCLE